MSRFIAVSALLALSFTVLPASAGSVDAKALGEECARRYPADYDNKVQTCIVQGLKAGANPAPSAKTVAAQGKVPSNKLSVSSSSSVGNLVKDAQPKEVDPTQGCEFLVITTLGLSHKPGTRLCLEQQTMECDMSGKNARGKLTYAWRVLSENSCVSGYQQASLLEHNGSVYSRVNEQMKKVSGD